MIALSFTRKASDIENLRDLMGPRGYYLCIFVFIFWESMLKSLLFFKL